MKVKECFLNIVLKLAWFDNIDRKVSIFIAKDCDGFDKFRVYIKNGEESNTYVFKHSMTDNELESNLSEVLEKIKLKEKIRNSYPPNCLFKLLLNVSRSFGYYDSLNIKINYKEQKIYGSLSFKERDSIYWRYLDIKIDDNDNTVKKSLNDFTYHLYACKSIC